MRKLYFGFLLIFGLQVLAQTPVLDQSFNTADNGYFRENAGKRGVVLSTGKILAVYSPDYNTGRQYVTRLNADGGVDDTFTMSDNIGISGEAKIYAKSDGSFITLSGTVIRKFDANGVLLATFSHTFTNSDVFNPMAVHNLYYLENGKIMVMGQFDAINGTPKKNLVLLDTDGSIDSGFSIGSGFNNETFFMEVTSDGKYLIAGDFGNYNGVTKSKLAKLNTDGSLDTTFGITGLVNTLNDIKILPDGKILVAGCNYKPSGIVLSQMLTRLNANGTRDASFAVTTTYNYFFQTIEVQPDGKIIYNDGHVVKRLNANGTPDATFTATNINTGITGNSLGQEGNLYMQGNKILVTTDYKNAQGITRMGIHRLNSDGTIDLTFNQSTGSNVMWMALLGPMINSNTDFLSVHTLLDQKILAIGKFTAYQDVPCRQICRLSAQGQYDPSFTLDPTVTVGDLNYDNTVNFIVRQQLDGKIILVNVSDYLAVNGEFRNIVRLNANGSLDNTFNGVSLNGNSITDIEWTGDKLLVSGYGNLFLQNTYFKLIRLDANGNLDASFSNSVTFADPPRLAATPDEKILATGESFKRLNADGTLDNTFNPS